MNTRTKQKRVRLVTWLFVPIILTWLAVAYLVGLSRVDATIAPSETNKVLTQSIVPEAGRIKPLVWTGEPLVTFWFDDAWKSQFTEGFPILKDRGYTGALAVPTRLLESDDYMTWPQVKQVHYKGWEITSHTRNHICKVEKYDNDQFARDELVGSLEDFEVHGLKPSHFVTPCGMNRDNILKYAESHYTSRRGTGQGVNPLPLPDEYMYDIRIFPVKNTTKIEDVREWIAEAKAKNGWLIIMFHQIDKSNAEYAATPEFTKAIADEVKKSGLRVVLPSEVIGMKVTEVTDEKK